MKTRWRAALAAAAFISCTAPEVRAQIDYRNLDDDRPTRIEDAYPVERFAFELLTPYRFERALHAFIPELAFGIVPNGMLGVKIPIAAVRENGATRWGLSTVRLLALYNFNTESPWLPAVSVRTDAVFPVGSEGGDETHVALKAIATRSFGRSRLHLNGSWTFGREGTAAAVEAAGRWWYGAAVDRTLFRHSTLVVAEVYALRTREAEPVEVNASLGLRRQITPVTVFDVGVSRGLRRNAGPELELTFGFSRALAIGALMPRWRRPTPPMGGGHEHH